VFEIDVQDDGVLLVLHLRGELDMSTVPEVEQVVARHGAGREAVVLDLGELEFLDSTGLRLMLTLQEDEDGRAVAFTQPVARVGRVLELAGVRGLLRWVDDPRDALG
jgi:anti-sigma B factor antagonist